jgi:Cu/Ag efflux pump CusA
VGEVVDDAIIDVENIFRRLRENAKLDHPRSAAAVVLSASLEVRSAVVYATFIVVLVFVPVFFLSGLQGRLFAPLGYAYVLAVLASLGVALTVSPALALLLLPQAGSAREPPLLRRLQGVYIVLLRHLDRQFLSLMIVMLVLVAAAGWALWSFGGEFLPELRENHFVVHMRAIPGTSLRESIATGNQITQTLKKNPAVISVAQQAGRAELGEDTEGVEYSELEVDLKRVAAADAEQTERDIKQTLDSFPGFSFEVMPFLTERIKEVLSGTPAAVAVKVYGDNLPAVDQAAESIARVLSSIPGNTNVRAEAQTGAPELVVRMRPADAARHGLRNALILDAVHAAYQGAEVGHVFDRNRIIPLVVQLESQARNDPGSVANLWLTVPNSPKVSETRFASLESTLGNQEPGATNGRVRLRQVADVFLSDGRFLIAHEGGTRRRLVTCNVEGQDVQSFVAEAERRVKELKLPEGIYYLFTGEHEAKRTAQRQLLLLSLAAGGGIFLLLWTAFRSLRHLFLILVNLPFALVGGIAAVYLGGGVLDVGSLVGFVTLFGITTRNGIMMISHWQHLQDVEAMPWGAELVFRGARERLAPVLMTALVTGLGLLPIAVGSGEAGREIEGPMAWVILGGLITSTVLNLIMLPVLYRRFGSRNP